MKMGGKWGFRATGYGAFIDIGQYALIVYRHYDKIETGVCCAMNFEGSTVKKVIIGTGVVIVVTATTIIVYKQMEYYKNDIRFHKDNFDKLSEENKKLNARLSNLVTENDNLKNDLDLANIKNSVDLDLDNQKLREDLRFANEYSEFHEKRSNNLEDNNKKLLKEVDELHARSTFFENLHTSLSTAHEELKNKYLIMKSGLEKRINELLSINSAQEQQIKELEASKNAWKVASDQKLKEIKALEDKNIILNNNFTNLLSKIEQFQQNKK